MRAMIGFFSVLFLAGCIGLQKQAPLQIVALPPAGETASAATAARSIDRQLTVAKPSASAMLDGQRVVVRHGNDVFAYLAGVTLPDNAPRLLQDRLIEKLQRSGFRAVERQGGGLRGDLLINLQLQQFEVDYSEPQRPQAKVSIQLLLIDGSNGRVLESRRLESSLAAAVRPAGAARSLLLALDTALAEAADWLVTVVSAPAAEDSEPAPSAD